MTVSARSMLSRGLPGAAVAVFLATGGPVPHARAQQQPAAAATQITGVPGSPRATTTIDGRYISAPPQKFGGEINVNAAQSKPYWPARVVPSKGAPNTNTRAATRIGQAVRGRHASASAACLTYDDRPSGEEGLEQ